MGDDVEIIGTAYFRKKENWFKELLIKFRLLKPKYQELGKIKEIKYESED